MSSSNIHITWLIVAYLQLSRWMIRPGRPRKMRLIAVLKESRINKDAGGGLGYIHWITCHYCSVLQGVTACCSACLVITWSIVSAHLMLVYFEDGSSEAEAFLKYFPGGEVFVDEERLFYKARRAVRRRGRSTCQESTSLGNNINKNRRETIQTHMHDKEHKLVHKLRLPESEFLGYRPWTSFERGCYAWYFSSPTPHADRDT